MIFEIYYYIIITFNQTMDHWEYICVCVGPVTWSMMGMEEKTGTVELGTSLVSGRSC